MDEFLGGLKVQGYSPNTTKAYGKCLEHFTEFIASEGKDIDCRERKDPAFVDYSCLLRWLQKIRLRGVGEKTLQGNKSAVSSWYEWLIRIGRVERNPIDMLPAIKLPEKLPNPLPPNETAKLCDDAEDAETRQPERNQAILELLYGTGLRRFELVGLDVTDLALDAPTPYLRVRFGKGRRDGTALLSKTTVEALKRYLEVRNQVCRRYERPASFQALFVTRKANRMLGGDVYRIVRKIARTVLGKEIHPHQLRHSFGTDLLNNGADLLSIRDLMRHKTLKSTEIYLRVTPERLKDQFNRHPRA